MLNRKRLLEPRFQGPPGLNDENLDAKYKRYYQALDGTVAVNRLVGAGRGYLIDVNQRPVWNLEKVYPLMFRVDRTRPQPEGLPDDGAGYQDDRSVITADSGNQKGEAPPILDPGDMIKFINSSVWDASLWTLRGPVGAVEGTNKFKLLEPIESDSVAIVQSKVEYKPGTADSGAVPPPVTFSGIIRFLEGPAVDNDYGMVEIRVRADDIIGNQVPRPTIINPVGGPGGMAAGFHKTQSSAICIKVSQHESKIHIESIYVDGNGTHISHQTNVTVNVKNFKFYITDYGEGKGMRANLFCRCTQPQNDSGMKGSTSPHQFGAHNVVGYTLNFPKIKYKPNQTFYVSLTKVGPIVTEIENLSIS